MATGIALPAVTHPLRSIFRVEHLPEAFLFVVAAAALGIGGTLVSLPRAYQASATLSGAFAYAPSSLWGLVMVASGVVVAATAVLKREAAIWSCIVLAIVWTLWGLATLPAVTAGRGVPSGAFIYPAFGVVTALSGVLARVWHTRPRT